MADRIKGITVEIGGDVTKLNDALRSVNTRINSTQSALKDVERLLKMDPTNTELLAQKQKLLTQAIEETEGKLKTLKEAEQQVQEQFQRGEISEEQYNATKREIIATEEKLKSLRDQAEQSAQSMAKLAEAGKKMQDVGQAIEGAGKKMLPVTGAITALGAAAIKTAADFDSAMSQVAAVSGATGNELEALREKAREMGAKTKFSASEAAEAMNYMAMAGWKTADMLDGIEGIMNLAAASGEELATTSDIVTDALTAFGLSAEDSGHFADILAAASSNANTNVAMMGETFKYAAPVLGAMGYSAEDAAVAIGMMGNAGIKSSQAGTALRGALTSLAKPSDSAAAAMEKYGISLTDTQGNMLSLHDLMIQLRERLGGLTEAEQAQAATTIFGKNAMSGMLAIINGSDQDFEKLTAAIAGCDGTAASMAETMQDNLAGQVTILKSQLEELAISFGEMLMPMIRDVVSAIQGFVDKLNSMDEGTRQTIITIAAVVAAIGPLLIIIGKITTGAGALIALIPKIAAAINAISGGIALFTGAATTGSTAATALASALTFITGPAGLAVAAIAAIIAVVVILWNNCESFRAAVTAAWEAIKQAFQAALDWIQATFEPVWDAVVLAMQTVFQAFQEALTIAWEAITEVFQVFESFLMDVFGVTWEDVFAMLQEVLSTFGSVVQTIIQTATTIFTGLINWLTATFLTWWQSAWNNVINYLTAFKDNVVQIIDGVKTIFQGVIDFVTGVFTGDWERAWQGVQDIFRGIFEALEGIVKAPLNGVIFLLNKAIGFINMFIDGINEVISVINMLGAGIPTIPSIPEIAYLAKGGILEAGSAVVGENGPELLSLLNGKARVTPLSSAGNTGSSVPAAAGFNQTLNFYGAEMTPSQVARKTRNATRKMLAGVKA
ncbi:phage tail tape measure protein [Flintibacter porci]|uniref:phage tail tape measure protein n=1 Tax=Flintibacter porci TaxID=3342383 RepID=UPI003F8C978B